MNNRRSCFRLFPLLALLPLLALCQCSLSGVTCWDSGADRPGRGCGALEYLVCRVTAAMKEGTPLAGDLSVTYPFDGSLFPAEMASPTVTWRDGDGRSSCWLLSVQFGGGRKPLYVFTDVMSWTPDRKTWENIKAHSKDAPAWLTVCALSNGDPGTVIAACGVTFGTSVDPVGDTVFFRQIPLPFSVASRSFEKTRWRLGDIASYEKPATVMTGQRVCASCHAFSADGRWMSMEYNLGGDNGAQFIAEIRPDMVLGKEEFFSWSDYPRGGLLPPTRGLFGRMSPSGRYAAASVNEISFATVMDDLDYCQLFFPTYGVIAVYDRERGTIRLLPGASDYSLVQANPAWSPDERSVVFCRAKTRNEVHRDLRNVTTVVEKRSIHELNALYPMRFDLYQVPFNGGEGGVAEPLEGASENGMSNYFARYSPDGKWIVFTKSPTGIMLQPDSALWIIPAAGGKARRMTCNRGSFNSWHSWSSNGRWLLFSSKANGPYTEIFLTHVDEEGNDTPPVILTRFNEEGYAANVPEFAPVAPGGIRSIRVPGS